jgi:hypothetical protein
MVDIERLPLELKAKLESEELLQYVNITTDDKLDTEAEAATALAALTTRNERVGAGIVIGQPVPIQPPANVMGPELPVRIAMVVLENPTINRDPQQNGTGLTARQIAIYVMQVLQHFGIEGLCTQLYVDPQTPWQESGDFEKQGYQALDIFFQAVVPLEDVAQCSVPTLTEAALEVTLTAGDAEDTVYYSVAGEFPGVPVPVGGTLPEGVFEYSAPFTVASGTTVRWAAWQSGKRGSDVGSAVIS